jgi:hypothetical protein
MATKTFTASKDSIVALDTGTSASFGAGKDYHIYVGNSGVYAIRGLVQFNLDFSNVGSINSATLYLKTSRNNDGTVGGVLRDSHGTFNAGAVTFSRITSGAWTEGTFGADEAFNGSNSVEWSNQPSVTTSGAVSFTTRSSRPSSPATDTVNITDIVRAWAPLSVTGGGNAANYGIQIRNTENGSDYCEWYSVEGGASGISGAAAPYIVIDYNAAAPTVTIGSPSTPAANGVAKIVNLNDVAEWSASTELARPQLGWNYASAASLPQTSWRVRIYSLASGGVKYYDSGQVTDIANKGNSFFQIPTNAAAPVWLTSAAGYTGWSTITGLVNGTVYYWTIEVTDSSGNTSSESARNAFKVRWGQVIHVWDSEGTGTSQWSVSHPAAPAGTQAHLLYRSTATSTETSGPWSHSLSEVSTANRYLQTLIRLSSDAGAQPSLGSISFTYLDGTVSPDNWEVDANGTIDLNVSTYRFGTKSGYLKANTAAATIAQPKRNIGEYDIAVIGGNAYVFSAYVQPDTATRLTERTIKLRVYEASGNSATLGTEIGSGSANYKAFPEQDGWYRLTYQFAAADGVDFVKPVIEFGTGSGAAGGDGVFLDGAQVEEGTVVRSWTPGFVTQAITIEGGGITVDKQNGGSFRLRGSDDGSLRNVVALGAKGLEFGGTTNPAQIYGADEYQLTLDGHLRSLSGTTTSGAFYSSLDTDTVDRFAILADGTHEWGAGVAAARDTNLYRAQANVLKTDDSLWIAGNTFGTVADGTVYDKEGAADSTVITTATTFQALTSSTNPGGFQDVTFTPKFVGQRWLMTYTGYASINTTTIQYIFVRCSITDASATIVDTNFAFTRAENFGTTSRGMAVAMTKVWVADTTDTRKFKLYGTTQTTSGLTLSMSYGQLHAIPLG